MPSLPKQMTIPSASSCTRLLTPSFSFYRFVVLRTSGWECISPSLRPAGPANHRPAGPANQSQAGPSCDGIRPAQAGAGRVSSCTSSRLTEKLNIQNGPLPVRVICGSELETCHRLLTLRLARREQSESARPGPAWLRLAARGISCVFKFSTCH